MPKKIASNNCNTDWRVKQNRDALLSEPMISRKNLPQAEKARMLGKISKIQRMWAEREKRKLSQ